MKTTKTGIRAQLKKLGLKDEEIDRNVKEIKEDKNLTYLLMRLAELS